jgi:hypothetical protein
LLLLKSAHQELADPLHMSSRAHGPLDLAARARGLCEQPLATKRKPISLASKPFYAAA